MRLWHYKLIPVLPNAMLVSQWRECIAIKRQWEKGTLKHRLVSYVMNYERYYLGYYVYKVKKEMEKRNIKFQEKYYDEILTFCTYRLGDIIFENYQEHNNRYLKQCYYNLQEKYDRGIITDEEWKKIKESDENFFLILMLMIMMYNEKQKEMKNLYDKILQKITRFRMAQN